MFAFFVNHYVLPAGIEPTSQAPQACVLSIKLRELWRKIITFQASLQAGE